ncbi:MAG: hypothetical protein R2713_20895 [Ilumatobacteraceae bacterium]
MSVIVVVVSVLCGVVIGGLASLVGFVRKKTETIVDTPWSTWCSLSWLILLLAPVSIFEVRDLFIISFVIGVLSILIYTCAARANSLA